jgi:hypothetical protein
MITLVSRFLLQTLTGSFASSIALWPFVIVRDRKHLSDNVLINHEKIHIRQQIELLVIIFYIWYILEYLYYRLRGMDSKSAYRNIRFEREAYQHESNSEYLNNRKCYAYIRKQHSRK